MEYEAVCPHDGPVVLGYATFRRIEAIDADRVRLTFECPQCEQDVAVTTEMPERIDEMLETYNRLRVEDARRIWRRDRRGDASAGEG